MKKKRTKTALVIGDKVKVRSWGSMQREYGLETNASNPVIPFIPVKRGFMQRMKPLCNKIVTIRRVGGDDHFFIEKCCFNFSIAMFTKKSLREAGIKEDYLR